MTTDASQTLRQGSAPLIVPPPAGRGCDQCTGGIAAQSDGLSAVPDPLSSIRPGITNGGVVDMYSRCFLKRRRVDSADLQSAAFALKLEKVSSNLLSDDDISLVMDWLREEASLTDENGEDYMDFEGMWRVRDRCRDLWGDELDRCFLATTFLKLQAFGGAVPVEVAGEYIRGYVEMKKLHIQLCQRDLMGTGLITPDALEDCLEELQVFEKQGMDFMRVHRAREVAVLKFSFHHCQNGSMRIVDLLTSPITEELKKVTRALENGKGKVQDANNWFSRQSVETVLEAFRELDSRGKKSLQIHDLLSFEGAKFTSLFVKRMFDEHMPRLGTPNGVRSEMDIVQFTRFVLAWRDKSSSGSIRYFFPIFDVDKKGYLTYLDVHMFFREVFQLWRLYRQEGCHDPNMCENVVNEIFEMVKPRTRGRIYKKDLEASGKAGTVFGILADMWEFWKHENGEEDGDLS